MKILLITDNHHPAGGGAEQYFFELKKRLQQLPEIEVYSLGFGPKPCIGPDFQILKCTRSNFAKLIWQITFNPFVYRKIRRFLTEIRPDVIHLHNNKQYSLSVLRAIRAYPVVQTIHDFGVVCPVAYNIHKDGLPCATGISTHCFWQHQVKYNPLVYLGLAYALFKLRKVTKKTVRHFFAPSPTLVAYLERHAYHPATCILPFVKAVHPLNFAPIQPYHFFFAGNLGAHKGIYILINEFVQAYQQEPRLRLTIAGTGHEEEKLRQYIKKAGVEQAVLLCGWKEKLDLYYQQCAAVIFPSLWMEAFGLVMAEAMHHGRPIIGSNRGSPTWLIQDGQTGFLFDPLKQGDLAEKILSLAGNLDLIQYMGTKGNGRLYQLCNNEKVLKQIVSLYKDAQD